MKAVVLDGFCLNPGDLNWGGIAGLCDKILIYDRTPKELVVERAQTADAIFVNKVAIDKEVMDQLPRLKYIGVLATGYNVVNIEYAKKKGIVVTNVPAYSTESVLQTVFGLIIELASGIGLHNDSVKSGEWCECPDFCYRKKNMFELSGKTLGVIGYGQIGKRVEEVAKAFGMKVVVNNRDRTGADADYVPLDKLLSVSDIVTLHCPLNKNNAEMINRQTLSLMKRSAVLINTARGGLINENDLADALNNSQIAGAGLDVLTNEPPESTNPLLTAKNCIITPHIAWATIEARSRLMDIASGNFKAFINGKPENVVNK